MTENKISYKKEIMKSMTDKYWVYDTQVKWYQKEYPYLTSLDDISDFLDQLDFLGDSDLTVGDEFDKIDVYDHPHKDIFLFHFALGDFRKIVFADNLPSMLFVMEQLNHILNASLRTDQILESMKEE